MTKRWKRCRKKPPAPARPASNGSSNPTALAPSTANFLEFLDETRRELASDIYKNNDHGELLEDNNLTDAVQHVIDRILFLRICEDRDIDTGERLQSIVETLAEKHRQRRRWPRAPGNDALNCTKSHLDFGTSGKRVPKDSLWRAVVQHFRALDRRPPTHVPFFNGNLFKPHFTENL